MITAHYTTVMTSQVFDDASKSVFTVINLFEKQVCKRAYIAVPLRRM